MASALLFVPIFPDGIMTGDSDASRTVCPASD
jgi:hypothetical protein